jgi:hypothetical protein
VTEVGTIEGLREHMQRVHQLEAPDEALEFALQRARSYSGSEAGVCTVASKWVLEAAEAQRQTGAPLDGRP